MFRSCSTLVLGLAVTGAASANPLPPCPPNLICLAHTADFEEIKHLLQGDREYRMAVRAGIIPSIEELTGVALPQSSPVPLPVATPIGHALLEPGMSTIPHPDEPHDPYDPFNPFNPWNPRPIPFPVGPLCLSCPQPDVVDAFDHFVDLGGALVATAPALDDSGTGAAWSALGMTFTADSQGQFLTTIAADGPWIGELMTWGYSASDLEYYGLGTAVDDPAALVTSLVRDAM